MLSSLNGSDELASFWRKHVHSVFAWAGPSREKSDQVLRLLTGDANVVALGNESSRVTWRVTDGASICGPLRGLSVTSPSAAADNNFVYSGRDGVTEIITSDSHPAFIRADRHDVPVFFCTNPEIIDVDAVIPDGNFDVRNHFLSAVPAVAYLKWAFPATCWSTPEINACLVIDDPVLKPDYGLLNFEQLLAAMRSHNFSTSIAFIPWNWRRSVAKVVRLFKDNPSRYSLSIHGCDHTGSEFGIQRTDSLTWKAKQALQRMGRLESLAGIPFDRVMVFPQGKFSDAAMGVLKRVNYTAAVNTEIVSVPASQPIKGSGCLGRRGNELCRFPDIHPAVSNAGRGELCV